MVMSNTHRVLVILDREYGDRLANLDCSGPVWIVDTPRNRKAAEKIWTVKPKVAHLDGVTTFKIDISDSLEANLIDEMDTIDLHHGIHSSDPAYTILEIIGTQATERIKAELARYDFHEFLATDQGFVAKRPLPTSLRE